MDTLQTIIKPGRDKKPYRLRCRFKIEPYPRRERLDREKVTVAERFVEDMRKQGWVYNHSGFKMTGPYPAIDPITIHVPKTLSAREMLAGVSQGQRFLAPEGTVARLMPTLTESEVWEYEVAAVFIRDAIMTELPDLHEERG